MTERLHIVDITESNFQSELMEASMATPVLVDFWATWCGPCQTLTPLLEELAGAYDGAFRLAKVDVDKNPMLASQFGAQSVPMVFAIFQGRLVDRFTGVLPRAELTRFVESVLERCGVSPPVADAADEAARSPQEREAHLRARLQADADDHEALLELGIFEMQRGQSDAARELLAKVPAAADFYARAQAQLGALDLLAHVEEAGGEAGARDRLSAEPDAADARYIVACADGARGAYVKALEALVKLVSELPGESRDRARATAAVVFEAAGRGDAEVEALRRRLSVLLF